METSGSLLWGPVQVETFEFPGVTPLIVFILVLYYYVMLILINCSTSGKKSFIWTYYCVHEVTQRITTGVIPMGQSVRKGLTTSPTQLAASPPLQ